MPGSSHGDTATLDAIKLALRERRTYEHRLPAADQNGAKRIRSLGRRAGRELGWKVRTFLVEPAEGGGTGLVLVVVIESNPLHQQLMDMRADKALRKAFESGLFGPPD